MYLGNAKIALQQHATGLSCPLSCFSAENQMLQGKGNNSLTKALWIDVVLGRGWEEKFIQCGCLIVLKMWAHPVLPLHTVLACELQKYLIWFLFLSSCCSKILTPYLLQASYAMGEGRGIEESSLLTIVLYQEVCIRHIFATFYDLLLLS